MKECTRCKVVQSLEDFYKKSDTLDGRASWCKICMAWNKKRWYAREYKSGSDYQRRVSEAGKKHRAENPGLNAERCRRYKAANREILYQKNRAYNKANPERARAWKKLYKHRKRNAVGHFTPEQLKARIEYYGSKCYVCQEPYEEIDHVIPLSRGGTNWPGNLRPICSPCNKMKGNRIAIAN